MNPKKAQTTLETSLMFVIIAVALFATTIYLKRALQGRLKAAADDISQDQYSPTLMNSNITIATDSTVITNVEVENEGNLEALSQSNTYINERNTRSGTEEIRRYEDEPLF